MRTERLIAVQVDGGGDGFGGRPAFSPPAEVTGLRVETVDLHDPSLTQDELEIYFSSETGGVSDIWNSRRDTRQSTWKPASLVGELSSSGNDVDPDVSIDGLTLFFSSDRSGAGYRLYVSRRVARDQPWDPPREAMGLGASTADMGPSVDPTGLLMVFASQRGAAELGLYAASRADGLGAWEAVTALSEINSDRQDQNPALFDHGLSIIWSSRGPSNGSTSDLFETSRPTVAAPFSTMAAALTTLNTTTNWEGDPWISQDGSHIVFVSDRITGVSRIYEARR